MKQSAGSYSIDADAYLSQPPKQTAKKAVPRQPAYSTSASPGTKADWINPNQPVTVAGYDIPGGMVYVGTQLPTTSPYKEIDPCLINPKLRVDKARLDYAGQDMGYWPSYSNISPGARAAYLDWLMGDRTDPEAYIGYVFLFFYGLERRVFVDLQPKTTDSSAELAQIVQEVERLIALYTNSQSFQRYATHFVEACNLIRDPNSFANAVPVLENTTWQVPLATKVALGQIVAAGKPIPVDWLLSWYLQAENRRLRTPATRCAKEFQKLLRLRYEKKYSEGIVIKQISGGLRLSISPLAQDLLT